MHLRVGKMTWHKEKLHYCQIYSANEGKNIYAHRNPPGVMSVEAYGRSREVVFINTIILAKLDDLVSSFCKVIYNHGFGDVVRNNRIYKRSLKL
jgi:hypothetical protein